MKIKLLISAVLLSAILFAFKSKEGDPVRVHVVHHSSEGLKIYDTTFTISKSYDVNSFLVEKGLNPETVDIIDVDAKKSMICSANIDQDDLWIMQGDGIRQFEAKKILIKQIKDDETTEGDGVKEIRVVKMIDDDGNVTVSKTVNGEEQESIDIDMENLKIRLDSVVDAQNIDIDIQDMGHSLEMLKERLGDSTSLSEDFMWTDSADGKKMVGHMKVKVIHADDMSQDAKQGVFVVKKQIETDLANSKDAHKKIVMMKHPDTGQEFAIAVVSRVNKNSENEKVEASNSSLPIENLDFFPKPNDGRFTLAFDLPEKGDTEILILDMNGKEIYQDELSEFSGHYQQQIDISNQPSGTYILSITQNGKRLADKVIIH